MGFAASESYSGNHEGKSAARPANDARLTTEWGEIENGIRCRATVRQTVEVGEGLIVKLEFQAVPDKVPPHIKSFDASVTLWNITLTLDGGATWVVSPQANPRAWLYDSEPNIIPLDGSEIPSRSYCFWLPEVGSKLKPGPYVVRVRYANPSRQWNEKPKGWAAAKLWSGVVETPEFEVLFVPETPRTQTTIVPKRLILELRETEYGASPHLALTYSAEDTEEVSIPKRNGFMQAVSFRALDGTWHGTGGLEPRHRFRVWTAYNGEELKGGFRISIDEVHVTNYLRYFGGGRELWEREFRYSFDESDVQAARERSCKSSDGQ